MPNLHHYGTVHQANVHFSFENMFELFCSMLKTNKPQHIAKVANKISKHDQNVVQIQTLCLQKCATLSANF